MPHVYPYTDDFYYEEDSSAGYTLSEEPGEIDMPSFHNKAARIFKKEGEKVQRQRIVLIHDWTAEQWTAWECQKNIDYYARLIRDGYTLYVWQYPEVIQLKSIESLEQFKSIAFRLNIIPVGTAHLKRLMAAKHIPAKQIKFLVSFEKVGTSHLLHSTFDLTQYIQEEQAGIIQADVCNDKHTLYRSNLRKEKALCSFHYDYTKWDKDFIPHTNEHPDTILSQKHGHRFTHNTFSKINTLVLSDLGDTMSTLHCGEMINTLIGNMPNLRSLSFCNCLADDPNTLAEPLAKIEHLALEHLDTLAYTEDTSRLSTLLLRHTTHLKSFKANGFFFVIGPA